MKYQVMWEKLKSESNDNLLDKILKIEKQYINKNPDEDDIQCAEEVEYKHFFKGEDIYYKGDCGYIYFLHSNDKVKIGKAIDVEDRLKTFKTGNPDIEFLFAIQTNCMRKLEAYFHKRFSKKNVFGEWFKLSEEDVNQIKIQYQYNVIEKLHKCKRDNQRIVTYENITEYELQNISKQTGSLGTIEDLFEIGDKYA